MTSSPGSSVRATACASRKFSVVMFAPKAISSGALPVSRAAATRARASRSIVSCEVLNTPPSFAVPPRRCAAIASMTASGACDPPGPSRNAAASSPSRRARAGNCGRTAAGSRGAGIGPHGS